MENKINNLKNLLGCIVCTFFLSARALIAQEAQIVVDASKVLNKVSPLIYGSCMEDVNHEVYGGLYDQKIFGEGFEEPPKNIVFDNLILYEGYWSKVANGISVLSHPGAKLVSELAELDNGNIEADIKFTGVAGGNAGLIFRLSNPGKGAENFVGYEVSLAQNSQKIILEKYNLNRISLAEVGVTFNRYQWTHVRISLDGARILVFINKTERAVIDYTDKDNPFLSGKVGLRTWNANVVFQNLQVENSKGITKIPFIVKEMSMISPMWDVITSDNVISKYFLDTINPFSGSNSQLVQFKSGKGKLGVANRGLNRWGISVIKGQEFQGRLYLRARDLKGGVTVALQNACGTKTYASQRFTGITNSWGKYPFVLKSNSTDSNARFAIWIETPGKLWIDQVVLLQTGDKQFKGLPYRADIGNAMVNEGLTFLRYGGTMVNAPEYRFKKMIGDPDRRPPYKGHYYNYSVNSFGIEDFLKFSEVAGFTSSFAINIEETAQDASDMIEYLNGPITSLWGKKRAENGHPEPYKVKYVEIGNEEVISNGDNIEEHLHYIERFKDIYDAIQAKDTTIKLVISVWWRHGSSNMKLVFDSLNNKAAFWDYHPGADEADAGLKTDKEISEMAKLFHEWNPNTKLKIAIFEENGNLHNLQRALGHATILNAVRRHSEILLTSCPANALQPYKQNDNGWDQGQVFFTPSMVWGMPPYYAQQMASNNHLPLRISDITTGELDVTATLSEDGKTLVIHVVNYKGENINTSVRLQGFMNENSLIKIWTLSGNLNSENTPFEPEKIIPIETTESLQENSFLYDFPAYSYTIIRFENK
jgi:alpha-L-arabinofuranosidase